ncbi:MFS transporter [Steroidobacter flavus]|uniref:MFS transporter n=1 Tax=Steroidobacter flavus TaxID=1842136 RepID=A0ABV8SZ07_9GAMM
MMTVADRLALTAVCLASLMFGLEISSVPVILPTLEGVLKGDFKDLQWIMNAYTIACTAVLMAVGSLADRFGRKRMLALSVIAFGLASLACGLAQSTPVLIASRFLQGAAGGAMLISQIAVLSSQFQGAQARGRAFGAWGIVFGLGLGFGPTIGGAIAAVLGWPWVFLVHVPIAAITTVLVLAFAVESRDPAAGRVDIGGIVTLSLAVFGLTYFITQGAELGFASPASIAILAVTMASLIAFLLIERWSRQPMFDFAVFRIRAFSGALVGSVGMNLSFWPFVIYLPLYFQSGLGYDSTTTGLALLAYTLPTLLLPPLGERLALRYTPARVIPIGLFTIGFGFMLMRYGSLVEHASWRTMLPGCLLAGIGLGITNTPVTNTTTGAVPTARAGMASGIDMSARFITLAINIAVMGLILTAGIENALRKLLDESVMTRSLQLLAEKIAAGNSLAAVSLGDSIAHSALVSGFSSVMMYGAVGVWISAMISAMIFHRGEEQALFECQHRSDSRS